LELNKFLIPRTASRYFVAATDPSGAAARSARRTARNRRGGQFVGRIDPGTPSQGQWYR
jgi:hypothetical protein